MRHTGKSDGPVPNKVFCFGIYRGRRNLGTSFSFPSSTDRRAWLNHEIPIFRKILPGVLRTRGRETWSDKTGDPKPPADVLA